MSSSDHKLSSSEIEQKWYQHWENQHYFDSTPDDREPFIIIIPPPNITGVLHMGHMLNNTIQDLLIRKARLEGKNACWVPGTDHASIATEAKVVQMLREQGIKKSDLSREDFLKHAFLWKEKYGGIILQQLRALGASCDWKRTAFTMDEARSSMVIKAFVNLYNKGKLYRRKRMVNWDPEAKTVLSNEEVHYHEEQANLFHILYKIEGSEEGIVIATQRPETIMADRAVAVNPNDERYKHLQGKFVKIPLIDRYIPIIPDDYVDMEFGTGALKVTPAHDQNDYEIGVKHQLEIVDILNEDGTLNDDAIILVGMDRFEARKRIKKLLEEEAVLIKIESYKTNIGRSERTNAVVEPRLSLQWYVDMKSMAKDALDAVENGDILFYPENMKNTYRHWMDNIKDWCISRQLWWGHRVPAFYYQDEVFVHETAEGALQLAKIKTANNHLTLDDLKQDDDVLDTWFSSWLWPISVFEKEEDLNYYYPTSVLVTGWDIIFLWVARMIMAGYEWKNKLPFKEVYFTGMVRDKLRRKMSKSLGNSPDALKLIADHGADGVRFGMLACSPAGGDLLFDEKLCEQGAGFVHKLWNARILVGSWTSSDQSSVSKAEELGMNWMEERTNQVIHETNGLYKQYKLSEALKLIYSFVWDDFCSFYLELIKPKKEQALHPKVLDFTKQSFENICTLLHPFMPFITEELWHLLRERAAGDDCMVSVYPKEKEINQSLLDTVSEVRQVITQVAALRQKYGVKYIVSAPLYLAKSDNEKNILNTQGADEIIQKLANISSLSFTDKEVAGSQSFLGLRDQYFIILPITIDVEEERKKILSEIEYTRGFLESVEKKLSNEKFVANAAAALVEKEKQKKADGLTRLAALEASLAQLES